jgi:hypothetical protein
VGRRIRISRKVEKKRKEKERKREGETYSSTSYFKYDVTETFLQLVSESPGRRNIFHRLLFLIT